MAARCNHFNESKAANAELECSGSKQINGTIFGVACIFIVGENYSSAMLVAVA